MKSKIRKFLFKFTAAFLLMASTVSPNFTYAADQWDKTKPAGTESAGTIDDLIRVNQSAQDRLFTNYRLNMSVVSNDANDLTVLAGDITIPNAAGSVIRYRQTASPTTINWSNIDSSSSDQVSTQYYVYATADTDISGCVYVISTSSSSPSSSTYYRKIGYFYNDASGNITSVGNIKGGDVANSVTAIGTTHDTITDTSYGSQLTETKIYVYSSGRPTRFTASIDIDGTTNLNKVIGTLNFDGSADSNSEFYAPTSSVSGSSAIAEFHCTAVENYVKVLSAGMHTIYIQMKIPSTGTITAIKKVFNAEEL